MTDEFSREDRWWVCALGVLFVALLAISLLGCPRPTPGPNTNPGAIQCASEAIQKHWPEVLPAVNRCLVSASDNSYVNCLLGLISPAAGITEETIACLVRDRQAGFAESANANPADKLSARAADRAGHFLQDRHYQFVGP